MSQIQNNQLPEKLGKYNVISFIGKGNHGTVYKVKDEIGQIFAIKRQETLRNHEKEFLNKIIKTKLSNLIQVYDYFEQYNQMYIVTEFCNGGELQIKKYDLLQAVQTILQLIDQLEIIHSLGYIFQDLKPANIVIQKNVDNNIEKFKLCDFGSIITNITNSNDSQLTQSRGGTPNYQAPEIIICQDENKITHLIDGWALGLIFYEILTGKKFFHSENIAGVIGQMKLYIKNEQKIQLEIEEQIKDQNLSEIIGRMIKINPNCRSNLNDIKLLITIQKQLIEGQQGNIALQSQLLELKKLLQYQQDFISDMQQQLKGLVQKNDILSQQLGMTNKEKLLLQQENYNCLLKQLNQEKIIKQSEIIIKTLQSQVFDKRAIIERQKIMLETCDFELNHWRNQFQNLQNELDSQKAQLQVPQSLLSDSPTQILLQDQNQDCSEIDP